MSDDSALHRAFRVVALFGAVSAIVFGLSGCTGQPTNNNANDGRVRLPSPKPNKLSPRKGTGLKGKRVVYLINGALGDNGIYDAGQRGVKALEAQFGVRTQTLEANFDGALFSSLVDEAFENAEVVLAIAFGFEEDLKNAAAAHPNTVVVSLDSSTGDEGQHVTSVELGENESAFLAGAAAALLTTDTTVRGIGPEKTVGLVQGDTDPSTSALVFAFTNGAKTVDSAISVKFESLNGRWDDVDAAKRAAFRLYDQEVDVVFDLAGPSGVGVADAAKVRNLYAISKTAVGKNELGQNELGQNARGDNLQIGNVVAVDVTDLAACVTRIAALMNKGSYKPGALVHYGLASGCARLDLAPGFPAASAIELQRLRREIIVGTRKLKIYKP